MQLKQIKQIVCMLPSTDDKNILIDCKDVLL